MNGRGFRDRMLTAWADTVTRWPRVVLAAALVLTVSTSAYTVANLSFRSDRSELIEPSLPWQQRYAAYKREFPRWDDAVVVVDRGESDETKAAAESFIAALEAQLKDDPRFGAVTAGFRREEAPAGMILTRPIEEVRAVVAELKRTGPVLASPTLDGLLGLSWLGGRSLDAAQRADLRGLMDRIVLAGDRGRQSVIGMEAWRGTERLLSSTGRLATVLVSLRPAAEEGDEPSKGINHRAEAIEALRGHIAEVKSLRPELAEVKAGVTGVPVLESDETSLSMRDAAVASALALGLIAALMLIAYRGVVVPVFAVLSLLIGMAWSFGWATAAVGHLQLLSVTFASILLGLGIDVAIHLIARLELVHADHDHLAPAIEQAFRGVGPGILTASLTIAAAAGAMALTDFRGVAEMGIIAAGGILLCTAAILCCFPAMLMLMKRPEERLRSHDGGEGRPFMGGVGLAFHRHPAPVLVSWTAVLASAGWLASGVGYDPDLEKLMPAGTESLAWQRRLERDDSRSVWHAVVVARTFDEAKALAARFRSMEEIGAVGGVGMLIDSEESFAAKQAALASLPDVSSMLESGDGIGGAPPSATQIEAVRSAAKEVAQAWREKDAGLSRAAFAVSAMSDDQLDRAMVVYRSDRRALLTLIASLRACRPPTPSDLPPPLRGLMVGSDGGLLLRIYPVSPAAAEGGQGVLSPARLDRFASVVLASAPTATGPAIQIYESSRLITSAYKQAGLFALAAIVVLLLLDFGLSMRGVGDTVCALIPVFGGAAVMLAVMRLADVPLNFANMIVLPLLIGIGVGCGVHAVRRWRLQPNDHPLGLAGGSGRAVTLTTLTTVIGFASMMTGEHRGIWSLGFVMSVGLGAVWAVTILFLPAVLRLRRG